MIIFSEFALSLHYQLCEPTALCLISGWMVLQFATECSESWGEGRHDIGRSIELLRGKLSWGWIGSIKTRCSNSACCSNLHGAIDNIWLNYQKWAGGRQTLRRHAEEGLAKPRFPAQQKVLSLQTSNASVSTYLFLYSSDAMYLCYHIDQQWVILSWKSILAIYLLIVWRSFMMRAKGSPSFSVIAGLEFVVHWSKSHYRVLSCTPTVSSYHIIWLDFLELEVIVHYHSLTLSGLSHHI